MSDIITDVELEALRAGYSGRAMNEGAIRGVTGPFASAAAYAEFVRSEFYGEGARLPPAHRERVVVALLAAQPADPGFQLAVHVYWAIGEGIAPSELQEILRLVGVYAGLPRYTVAAAVLARALGVLSAAARDGRVTTPEVVAALRQAFG